MTTTEVKTKVSYKIGPKMELQTLNFHINIVGYIFKWGGKGK